MVRLLSLILYFAVFSTHRMGLYDPSNPYHYFNNEQELGLAIKYLKKIGITMHSTLCCVNNIKTSNY